MGGSAAILAASWGYALLLLGWFGLHRRFGDRRWQLALLAPFAPHFFWPILGQIGGALWLSTPLAWLGWLAVAPPLLILGWLYADYFGRKAAPAAVDAGSTFTLMTFNIWWQSRQRATARTPLEIGAVTGAAPDVVALQELLPPMAQLVAAETAHLYPYRLFDVGEAVAARRLGVISRYPLELVDASHLQAKDFRVQMVRVHLPQRPILLYNIHPRATLIVRYLREGGPLGPRVTESFAQRRAYFERLLADMGSRREPIIVAGDFNSTDLSDVYKLLRGRLVDAQRAAGWGWGHSFPMHGADFGGLPVPRRLMRLDMIFCTPDLLPISCRVARIHGESDHLPVLATFGWRDDKERDQQISGI
ncbi:MAG: endonuclease/exonuclease/phosphatase family protein [Caldilineaceae bacterium]